MMWSWECKGCGHDNTKAMVISTQMVVHGNINVSMGLQMVWSWEYKWCDHGNTNSVDMGIRMRWSWKDT